MKKYEIGNIVKTKEGNKCIIIDFMDDEVLVFNLSEMHPDKIKEDDIVEKIQETNNTTIVINGKKREDKKNDKNESTDEEDDDIEKKFAELLKVFGKAAIELGEIFVKIAESDEDE